MKKPDLAQIYTDKETLRIEKEMRKVYKEAGKDIKAKLSDFNAKHKVKDNMYRQRVKDGLMEKADYDAWKQGQVFQKKEFKAKQEEIARTLTNANSAAHKIAQGHVNNVFAYNANYMHYKLEKGVNANLGFGLYNNASVARLLRDNPQLLPPKKLNPAKDIAWNMKGIKNQLTQSIIQGESIDELTERLSTEMPNRSYKQARTHARTMMTSAQNAGRLEAMKEHQAMGIDVAKKWLATLDERTRWMHRDLDGQEKELDEYFEVGQYTIRYPADPLAAPAMVYNCRCSMEEVLKKYPDIDKMRRDNTVKPRDMSDENDGVIKYMTYNQWAEWKGIANERPNGMKPVMPVEEQPTASIKETLMYAYTKHIAANALNSVSADKLIEMSERYGQPSMFDVDYGKMDSESIESVERTIGELVKEYDTPLASIRVMSGEESLGNKAFAVSRHNYENDTAEIIINTAKCGDSKKLIERLSELRERGYIPRSVPDEKLAEYVYTHEFGHTMLNMEQKLVNNRNWVGADYGKIKKARSEIEIIYNEYATNVGKVQKDMKAAEFDFIIGVDNGDKARALKKQLDSEMISTYSLTNSDEFLAESFAGVRLGNIDNDYAKRCVAVLDKYFKR